jgi:hypothetical protein
MFRITNRCCIIRMRCRFHKEFILDSFGSKDGFFTSISSSTPQTSLTCLSRHNISMKHPTSLSKTVWTNRPLIPNRHDIKDNTSTLSPIPKRRDDSLRQQPHYGFMGRVWSRWRFYVRLLLWLKWMSSYCDSCNRETVRWRLIEISPSYKNQNFYINYTTRILCYDTHPISQINTQIISTSYPKEGCVSYVCIIELY